MQLVSDEPDIVYLAYSAYTRQNTDCNRKETACTVSGFYAVHLQSGYAHHPEECFLHLNMGTDYLGILLKYRLWLTNSGLWTQTMHFSQAIRGSTNHTEYCGMGTQKLLVKKAVL